MLAKIKLYIYNKKIKGAKVMPKKKDSAVDAKLEELEKIDLDSVELEARDDEVADLSKKEKTKSSKKDKKAKAEYTPEQKEIAKLKSQLLQEKIKNVGKKKSKNFITKKEKRKFRDTSYDSNATLWSILKGAGFMFFAFGLLALIMIVITKA